jgi:hypothetical protein
MVVVPLAHAPEQRNRPERDDRKPGDAGLAARYDDERGEQRTERRSEIAAGLEE